VVKRLSLASVIMIGILAVAILVHNS